MKKIKNIFLIMLSLSFMFILVSCNTTGKTDDNEQPIVEGENDKELEDDFINVSMGPYTLNIDAELREKDVSAIKKFKLDSHESFKITLFMGGSYDNPMTVKSIVIDGKELDLNIDGLPTKASDHESGDFILDGYNIKGHRLTNYQPLRIKSEPTDSGYLMIDVTGVKTIEVELVFTTGAASFFEKVEMVIS